MHEYVPTCPILSLELTALAGGGMRHQLPVLLSREDYKYKDGSGQFSPLQANQVDLPRPLLFLLLSLWGSVWMGQANISRKHGRVAKSGGRFD